MNVSKSRKNEFSLDNLTVQILYCTYIALFVHKKLGDKMAALENKKEFESKQQIMKAASELFKKYGFSKTTIDEIAESARKSKTTIYQMFKNKEEILEEVLVTEGHDLINFVISKVNKEKNSRSELSAYIKTILSETKKRILLFSLIKGELKNTLLNNNKLRREIDTIEIELVKNILHNGIDTKEFSPKYKDHVDSIAYYITNFTRGLAIQLIMADNSSNLNKNYDQFDMFVDILVKGLKS